MTPRPSFLATLLLLSSAPLAALRADITFFPLFSDHAVLQASDHVPVWGRGTPGESVTVTLGGDQAKATAVAGADGKWAATLDLAHAGSGPFQLVAESAQNRVVAADVLVGEVWLCSGQSNMEFTLGDSTGGKEEAARSANPMLRHFRVTRAAEAAPIDTVQGRWEVAGPQTSGGFTAVGYYFGKKIQAETHAPVGLVHSSWGGTPVEAWTSKEGFAASTDADLKAGADKVRNEPVAFQRFTADYHSWQDRFFRRDQEHADTAAYTARATAGEGGWSPVTLPTLFATVDLPDAGAVWLQRTITISEASARDSVSLFLGDVHSSVEIYWNGKKIGGSEFNDPRHSVRCQSQDLKAGDNVLAVRLFEADQKAGIAPGKSKFRLEFQSGGYMPLAGPWLAKTEFELPRLAAGQEAAPMRPAFPGAKQDATSFLYNGMIAPLVPYALRGVLWYQGEANADRATQYRQAFPLMITDWRARWQRGDFSFYWCQLANFQKRQALPVESNWAELRDAQTNTLRLPNTGEAILIDVGEEDDIHPKDKLDVGERLARIALAKDYGQNSVVWSGPTFEEMKAEPDGKVRIRFAHVDGGLVATPIAPTYQPASTRPETRPNVRKSPGGQLEGFAVCGEDRQWHWATAANIDGDSVVLTCAEVPAPVAVRYAWANCPLCNLTNGAGLPAGPFRTDDFPPNTVKGKY